MIYSYYRLVGRYGDNVQFVDLLELVLFGHSSTCHTGELCVETEEVLESDGSKSLGLALYLNAFLCFDSLMQTVVETASHHETSGEFINDDNFAVLYNVIYLVLHYTVSLDSLIDVVEKSHILGIHEVLDLESLLRFLNTALCDSCGLCLFIYDVVSCFVDLILIRLVIHFYYCSRNESLGKTVNNSIEVCGLVSASGDDERSTSLINEDRVHLIDDSEVRSTLNALFLVSYHVVTEVIESELVIGSICYIAVVCCTALVIIETVEDTSYSKSEPAEHLAHFLSLCLCEVVIYSYNVNAKS